MKKQKSISEELKAGVTKAELMTKYCLSEDQMRNVLKSLNRIHAEGMKI